MSKPIAFIIGAGKNIGFSTADVLQSKGYRVALAARSVKQEDNTSDRLHINVDLSDPEAFSSGFTSLRKQWGEPSLVLYNAAVIHYTKPEDPFSPSAADLTHDLTLNIMSLYATVKEALASFDALPSSASKTFIYNGNKLNVAASPAFTTLGIDKVASAHIIEVASGVYGKNGFFYIDERKPDRAAKGAAIDGLAHGEFIASLVGDNDIPWHATFVAGEGYVKFPRPQLYE